MSTTETKVRHTPGPWNVERYEDDFQVWSPDVDDKGNRVAARIQTTEDAAVIAAAPDMLEALARILEEGEQHFNDNNGWRPVLTVNIYEQAREALKKARGIA